MIASLQGRVTGIDTNSVILEVNGVGFRVMLSTMSLAAVGGLDMEVALLTTMIVREDSIALYGFLSDREQQLFEKLITVSGIGPKVALSALSAFNADELHKLILSEDVSRIATIPGIGKKTAQRIILELRGVLDVNDESGALKASVSATSAQATEALLGMGFTTAEVSVALKGYEGDTQDVAEIIRFGLKRLGAS